MKLTSAISKLTKSGFSITEGRHGFFTAEKEGSRYLIEFTRNGGGSEDVATICARPKSEKPDSMTDYFPGTYCQTMKSAINIACEN